MKAHHAYATGAASSLYGRLLRGGSGALLASVVLQMLPLLGVWFLSAQDYRPWALLATIMTAATLFDLGGLPLIQQSVGSDSAARSTLLWAIALSGTSALVVGAVSWVLWTFAPTGLNSGIVGSAYLLPLLIVGTALRSAVVVISGVHLAKGRFAHRAALLVGQALFQVIVTLCFLTAGYGVMALPAGLAISSALVAAVCLPVTLRLLPGASVKSRTYIARFAVAKGVASVASIIIGQGDRWVVNAIADPDFFRRYDVAARFAIAPKAAVTAFFVGLVNEAAAARESDVRHILRRANGAGAAAVTVLSCAALTAALVFGALSPVGGIEYVVLVAAMLTWHGTHALTGPATLILTGRGRPELELRYLLPCLASIVVAWCAGLLSKSATVAVFGTGIAIFAWSLFFLTRPLRYLSAAGGYGVGRR